VGFHIYNVLRGPDRRDPRTGAVFPSQISVQEICDSAKDARKYVTIEHHSTTNRELRRVEFVCEGYFGSAGNLCGKNEDAAARRLAREWSEEKTS
jgi:hypothetical protein